MEKTTQPPTSTPSLDEVENPKAQPSIYGLLDYLQYQYPATCGDLQLREFCRGLLARHASLVAEVERLKQNPYIIPFDIHIPNQDNSGTAYIVPFWIECYKDQYGTEIVTERGHQMVEYEKKRLMLHESLRQDIRRINSQIATAEQNGYERGVREAARESGLYERSAKCLRVDKSCEQAILNLLNKKGTE
jgi:hypothetical protein